MYDLWDGLPLLYTPFKSESMTHDDYLSWYFFFSFVTSAFFFSIHFYYKKNHLTAVVSMSGLVMASGLLRLTLNISQKYINECLQQLKLYSTNFVKV